jgi:hypothetical protein
MITKRFIIKIILTISIFFTGYFFFDYSFSKPYLVKKEVVYIDKAIIDTDLIYIFKIDKNLFTFSHTMFQPPILTHNQAYILYITQRDCLFGPIIQSIDMIHLI